MDDSARTSNKKEAPAGPALPQPTLPKGGGALAPMGEKLIAHPQNGTASFSVPIFTSPGRGGFGPKLELTYDSGAGNGPFGLGWGLALPSITRKTDKGLPRYADAEESDVFILSGSEDLVPIDAPGELDGGERVVRYRPRVEGLFARIERRVRDDGSCYWVSYTRDNQRSVYGCTAEAQIVDPDAPKRIFRWLLEWTDDDRGNVVAYYYKREDGTGIAPASSERRRRATQTYLKAIGWLNPEPRPNRALPPHGDLSRPRADLLSQWPLVLLFDYGDHDPTNPTLTEGTWSARQDAFSSFRAGFDVRTYRLCRGIYMMHRFAALGPAHQVVRSTRLEYRAGSAVSYLTGIEAAGWDRPDPNGPYQTRSFPKLGLGYREISALDTHVHVIDRAAAGGLEGTVAGKRRFADYDGEGLPGIFSERPGGWYYQRPEGRVPEGSRYFGAPRALAVRPHVTGAAGWHLQDVTGDGLADLVRLGAPLAGTFERKVNDRELEWKPFRPFARMPSIDWNDPNLRFADLDGDGFPDLVVSDREVMRWHPALRVGERLDGYGAERRTPKPIDADDPGRVMPVFHNRTEAVFFADMSGDGLPDIVHIQNHSVAYWPNLGYGRFGQRIQMANPPALDPPDRFDPARIRLADVDGTGTSDLIYCGADSTRVYLNQAGNSFSDATVLRSLPAAHHSGQVEVLDLWGTGTACVVFTSGLPAERDQPLRFIDLLGSKKPHLLETIDNGFGALTTIAYAPSTEFYLKDRAAGRPWVTRLPFPVQVVAQVTVQDQVAATKLVTTYRYHHGYYDGAEREFRGFGMVEQEDSQEVAPFAGKSDYPRGLDETLHIPNALTRTWFHTGAYLGSDQISRHLADEYFPASQTLPDSTLPSGLSAPERREACRALRGHPLRVEIYALDGNSNPYTITETNYSVRLEHRRSSAGNDRHAVFSVFPQETLTVHTERKTDDPRIQHEVVLAIGTYGDVQEKVSVAYPRAAIPGRRSEQTRLWALHTRSSSVDLDGAPADYRVGIPIETVVSELVGLPADHLLSFAEVKTGAAAPEQPWAPPEKRTTPGRWVVRHSRVRYWNDAVSAELASGATVRALASRTLIFAFARADLVSQWAGRESGVDSLAEQRGGYLVDGDQFWASSGTLHYDPNAFFLPDTLTTPLGGVSRLHYEAPYLLLSDWAEDPAANRTTVENDYRLLAPLAITDANGTTQSVVRDPLGIVVATTVKGSSGEGGALTAIDYRFGSGPTPTAVHVRAFQTFEANAPVEEQWIYSDGSGREIQRKQRTPDGPEDPGDPQSPILSPRFVASGRTVFNNKGLPVKKYEPYLSPTAAFDAEAALAKRGVTPVLHYDPLGRLTATDLPNGTFRRGDFDAWTTTTWDEIDTLETTTRWYAERIGDGYPREPALEAAAAKAALALAQTPTVAHADALGRTVAIVTDAGSTDAQRYHETSQELDIEGAVLSVTDPRWVTATERLVVAHHAFDAVGRKWFEDSVDAGKTWTLHDALGSPIYIWRAEAGRPEALRLRHEYDGSHRLTAVWLLAEGASTEILRERIVYRDGAGVPDHGAGRMHAEFDGAGIVLYAYDFRGAVKKVTRHVLVDGTRQGDWTAEQGWSPAAPLPAALDPEELIVTRAYDARGREVERSAFTGTRASGTIRTQFDIAGQLAGIDADLPGRPGTDFVTSASYDAHGRPVDVAYGHGGTTSYGYDQFTFRLNTLETKRSGTLFQSLVYAYDPVGNITAIRDDAQDPIYFRGGVAKPERDYTYDALYRLTSAVGREHLSQATPDERDVPAPLALPLADPNDFAKVISYTERYLYDASGNLASLKHAGATNWTRTYSVDLSSNRLMTTTIGSSTSSYVTDTRGNTRSMAHLAAMQWNHRDQLVAATRTHVGNTTDPTQATPAQAPVYFAYDLRGERVRKLAVTPKGVKERIYLGGFELYRERASTTSAPTLERETLHIAGGPHRIALVETQTMAGGEQLIRYQHADHLGSAIVELDANATPLSYEEYHPYGTTSLYMGLASKRYRYIGKERDEETGLCRFGVRYYVPWLGRWTSADLAGLVDGTSLYQYAQSNPLTYLDSTGYQGESPGEQEPDYPPPFARMLHHEWQLAKQKRKDEDRLITGEFHSLHRSGELSKSLGHSGSEAGPSPIELEHEVDLGYADVSVNKYGRLGFELSAKGPGAQGKIAYGKRGLSAQGQLTGPSVTGEVFLVIGSYRVTISRQIGLYSEANHWDIGVKPNEKLERTSDAMFRKVQTKANQAWAAYGIEGAGMFIRAGQILNQIDRGWEEFRYDNELWKALAFHEIGQLMSTGASPQSVSAQFSRWEKASEMTWIQGTPDIRNRFEQAMSFGQEGVKIDNIIRQHRLGKSSSPHTWVVPPG